MVGVDDLEIALARFEHLDVRAGIDLAEQVQEATLTVMFKLQRLERGVNPCVDCSSA